MNKKIVYGSLGLSALLFLGWFAYNVIPAKTWVKYLPPRDYYDCKEAGGTTRDQAWEGVTIQGSTCYYKSKFYQLNLKAQ